ncbi:tetratricopeptide repeat protein [Sabulilitoribacter multivorans]|uniref:Tetratricopeptide repeat protein n=1 Tax=Flaviramulus multivorans TaxID=1304750 RepID=A0ABS9IH14_9FLAO|nr:tetratricopeptide repeat protein [Flaviramulus multivorans]MCF7559450.1 tetratricopeptide repeat protein [Flaviramulus multivorans]
MKRIITFITVLISIVAFSQEVDKQQLLALKKSNNYVYEANTLINKDDFISAEMEYRKAISEKPSTVAGTYNLGNAYYTSGNFEEALYRHQQAAQAATSKPEKHKAFHNIGNILMQNKKCKEAVEAYKNALRNDPTDDETRYNLGLAKICAEQQQDQQDQNKDEDKKDENKENQDQKKNEENKDKEGDNKEDKKDEGDQEKKEGEDEKDDEGKPKDEKEDKGKPDEEKKDQQKPKPQPGQLSPQQIKNLLEAMNNQEQKVQEKINAEKQKGVKVKTEKDW